MLIIQTNNYVTNVLEECEICAKATEGNKLRLDLTHPGSQKKNVIPGKENHIRLDKGRVATFGEL